MRAVLIGIGLIALAGILWAGVTSEADLAVSGCCKQKVDNNWRRIDASFESCQQLNQADGDNVFEPSGTYWWDAGC